MLIDSANAVRDDRADISFNSRFLLDYNEEAIEFIFPAFSDQFCIIAPAALEIPGWQLVFIPFATYAWLLLLIACIVCSIFWYILIQRSTIVERQITFIHTCLFFKTILNMTLLLMSAPLPNLPTKVIERVFLTFCLIFSIIIIGTFQVRYSRSIGLQLIYRL